MDKRCVLSNCHNAAPKFAMFEFPFKNPELLREWLGKIPKSILLNSPKFPQNHSWNPFIHLDLYSLLTSSSCICEAHFDRRFIRTSFGVKSLLSIAVPSIFTDTQEDPEISIIKYANSSKLYSINVLPTAPTVDSAFAHSKRTKNKSSSTASSQDSSATSRKSILFDQKFCLRTFAKCASTPPETSLSSKRNWSIINRR